MAYQRRLGTGASMQQQPFSSSSAIRHGDHATTKAGPVVPEPKVGNDISGGLRSSDHSHEHSQDHSHDHCCHCRGHSHGLFHSHAHDHDNAALVSALSKNDRGSRITLLGLGSNVLLTALKGVAGYAMNSASLIAEAGHSFSDMGADFVTLACWKVSRREPTRAYPYGYGKFETIGTLSVSLILVVAGIGIALHSYHLLLQVMIPWIQTLDPANPLQSLLPYIPSSIPSPLLELFHNHAAGGHEHDAAGALEAHEHAHTAILNPHAAWFALISVFVKEWLFRVTKKVADDEHSPVLLANAYQPSHRSDALTSGVALFSILGSHFGAPVLDPLGGIIVSIFILQQGLSLSKTSFLELLDKGITDDYRTQLERIVEPLVNGQDLLEIRNIRGVKAGGLTSLDLTITVPPTMSVLESHAVEANVRETIMRQRKEVRELKIHVHAQEEGEVLTGLGVGKDKALDDSVKHDFGRNGC
ncbi:hypothetical protein QFC20_005827 [Naganishia adeliensis]|uniref:Uncharacterized protein n=1 Tax=Naganishia adeliensis TaxID=92952 RepID=A0ACC2VK28_9TREE|nr:hypothetical protein QFC20_005827 [Naganishia adeliensis]